MSRQVDEPSEPPHQRLAVMDDDPDEDDVYEPKCYDDDDDDDEAKADRSRIGHFTGRGKEDPTHSNGKNPSHRKPSLPIRKDTSNFSKPPPKGLNTRGSLYTELPVSSAFEPKQRDRGSTNPHPKLPPLKKARDGEEHSKPIEPDEKIQKMIASPISQQQTQLMAKTRSFTDNGSNADEGGTQPFRKGKGQGATPY